MDSLRNATGSLFSRMEEGRGWCRTTRTTDDAVTSLGVVVYNIKGNGGFNLVEWGQVVSQKKVGVIGEEGRTLFHLINIHWMPQFGAASSGETYEGDGD